MTIVIIALSLTATSLSQSPEEETTCNVRHRSCPTRGFRCKILAGSCRAGSAGRDDDSQPWSEHCRHDAITSTGLLFPAYPSDRHGERNRLIAGKRRKERAEIRGVQVPLEPHLTLLDGGSTRQTTLSRSTRSAGAGEIFDTITARADVSRTRAFESVFEPREPRPRRSESREIAR